MDVTSLKQQATALERQGRDAEAAGLYRQILDGLEGSPGIKRELPLYAKAGDLLLKSGDAHGAIEMYERAAEHYAQHGSSKSIIVLCLRVLRADRKQTNVYLRFARRLLECGHVEASRAVLIDYATRGKLAKTEQRLESLARLPEDEVKRHLEQLFAKADRSARHAPPVAPAAPVAPVAPAPPAAPPPSRLVTADFTPPPEEAEPEREEAQEPEEPVVEHEEPEEPEAEQEESEEPVVAHSAHAPGGLPLLDIGEPRHEEETPPEPHEERRVPSRPAFEPSRGRDVLISAERAAIKKSHRRPVWLWPAIAAAAVVVIGGGLVVSGVIRFGGGEGGPEELGSVPAAPVAEDSTAGSDSAAMLMTLGDTAAVDSLGVPLAAVDSAMIDSTSPVQTAGQAPAVDSAAPGGEAAAPPAAAADSAESAVPAPLPPPVAIADSGVLDIPSTRLPPGVTVQGPILVVEGLTIESVEELATGGGYRVTQILTTGERLALTVLPLDQAPVGGAGALRVVTLPGDTAEGTVRMGDRAITARAAVAADVLERLLRRIVEVR